MHYCLGDYVLDIAQNAVEAGSRTVSIEMGEDGTGWSVTVEDDGRGMGKDELARALDPFYSDGRKHPSRKQGLGLPFLRQATDQAAGSFGIESERGRGTKVAFSFPAGNIDSPPTGDLPSLFLSLLCLPGDHELVVRRRREGPRALDYELVRSELAEALGDLERASSLALLRDYLVSQEADEAPETGAGGQEAVPDRKGDDTWPR